MTTMIDKAHEGGCAMASNGLWSMTKQTDRVNDERWIMTNEGDFWWMMAQNDQVHWGGGAG